MAEQKKIEVELGSSVLVVTPGAEEIHDTGCLSVGTSRDRDGLSQHLRHLFLERSSSILKYSLMIMNFNVTNRSF